MLRTAGSRVLVGARRRVALGSVRGLAGEGEKSGGDVKPTELVVDVNESNIKELVESPIPLVLDAWAPWCGPCRQLTPVLERVVRGAGGKVRLGKLNTDNEHRLARSLSVTSIPAVFGIRDGRVVSTFIGAQSEAFVKEFVDKLSAPSSTTTTT